MSQGIDYDAYRKLAMAMLEENGTIPIEGRFCNEMAMIVRDAIIEAHKKGMKEVTLLINSNGGSYEACLEIITTMREIPTITFIGKVRVKALSSAFILLQACHYRIAYQDARFCVHLGSSSFQNGESHYMLEAGDPKYIKNLLLRSLDLISARTGMSTEELLKLSKYDMSISEKDALEMNMIDEVIPLWSNGDQKKAEKLKKKLKSKKK